MADLTPSGPAPRYRPYVPVATDMQEFTGRR